MHRGRIVQQGPTASVMSAPDHPYTLQLLSAVPQMDAGWLDAAIAGSRAANGR